MYYTVYKTINLVNNKIYIGCHRTLNINDGYMGSGNFLLKAIAKYGKNNFKKEVMYVFDNPEEMFLKEKQIVDQNFIDRCDTYNICLGGIGGFSDITVAKNGRKMANMVLEEKYGSDWNKIISNLGSLKSKESIKLLMQDHEYATKRRKLAKGNLELTLTSPARKKRKDTMRTNGHQQGSKNCNYGKCWITNGVDSIMISSNEVIPDGWYKGRKCKRNKIV